MSAPQFLSRRRALASGAALTVSGLLAACSGGTAARSLAEGGSTPSGPAGSTVPLTLGLSYTPNVQFAPFYLAEAVARNASTNAANFTLRHHGAQEGLFDALLAGTEDVVIAGGDEAAVAMSGGNDLVIIGGYYQSYPGVIIVPEDSPVQSLVDLHGRSVGVPGRYGESWYTLTVALNSAGLSEEDLTIQEIGYTQQVALVSGRVDAIVGFSNNDAVQIRRAGTAIREIPAADEMPLVGASLVTSRSVLESRREELTALVAACAAGMESFVADPAAGVEATQTYVTDLVDAEQQATARAVAEATAALIAPQGGAKPGTLDTQKIAATIEVLSSQGLLGESPVDAATLVDPLLKA